MLLVVVALVNAVTTGSELLFLGDDTWEWVSDPEVNQVGATVSYERYRHYFDGTTDIPQMGSRSWT